MKTFYKLLFLYLVLSFLSGCSGYNWSPEKMGRTLYKSIKDEDQKLFLKLIPGENEMKSLIKLQINFLESMDKSEKEAFAKTSRSDNFEEEFEEAIRDLEEGLEDANNIAKESRLIKNHMKNDFIDLIEDLDEENIDPEDIEFKDFAYKKISDSNSFTELIKCTIKLEDENFEIKITVEAIEINGKWYVLEFDSDIY